jgi:thiamine biosynthesis lipoprotein
VSVVALAAEAMATRFELVLDGPDPARLRGAGEEALFEIDRVEAQLSRYRPTSEIAWINARAGGAAVRVDPRVLALLERCAELWRLTDGAFDVTVGPLLRAYGFVGGAGPAPDPDAVERARALVGMHAVELDRAASTVRLARRGMELDLGAIGKGHAIDRAIGVLEQNGVRRALLHGGTSSVHTIGVPGEGGAWRVAWRVPGRPDELRHLDERAPALSISGVHGKGFASVGGWIGHVLDPRSGVPTRAAGSACVTGHSSTLCDALSTALVVNGPSWRSRLEERFPGYAGWAAVPERIDGALAPWT